MESSKFSQKLAFLWMLPAVNSLLPFIGAELAVAGVVAKSSAIVAHVTRSWLSRLTRLRTVVGILSFRFHPRIDFVSTGHDWEGSGGPGRALVTKGHLESLVRFVSSGFPSLRLLFFRFLFFLFLKEGS